MSRNSYTKFQTGNYIVLDDLQNKVWRIMAIDGDSYTIYNPVTGKELSVFESDLEKIEMKPVKPNLLNWTSGFVTRDNGDFISGEYILNGVKVELSCDKGTDNYTVTDGLENFKFSFLHELQNYIGHKTRAQLRFSSDLDVE